MRGLWVAMLVLTTPMVTTSALAQPGAEARPSDATAAPAPSGAPADEDAATALIEQAARAYDDGRLDEALSLLARAHVLAPRPAIIYNQAQVLRAKNDCAAALEAYRRFIAAAPPGDPNRERAARRQTEMQACLDKPRSSEAVPPAPAGTSGDEAATAAGTQPPPAAPAGGPATGAAPVRLTLDRDPGAQATRKIAPPGPGPVPPQEESGARRLARVSGWALLGVSAVSAGAAAVLAWKMARLKSDLENDLFGPMEWNENKESRIEEGERKGKRYALQARWCAAAAALAAGGGATLLIVFRSPSAPQEAARPHDAAALVGLSGTF